MEPINLNVNKALSTIVMMRSTPNINQPLPYTPYLQLFQLNYLSQHPIPPFNINSNSSRKKQTPISIIGTKKNAPLT